MGMVLTTAFAGPRGTAKPTAGHRAKSSARVAQKISANPSLAARVKPLVPPGMTLTDAAAGFADESQFITALHIAKNIKVPFTDLKAEVAASEPDGLAQAVRALRPGENENMALRLAERQTRTDLKAAGQPIVRPEADKAEN